GAEGDGIGDGVVAGRLDGDGSESPIRRRRNARNARVRPPVSLAELDFRAAERGRRERRPEGLRNRRAVEVPLGACMSDLDPISYIDKIPNNVDLGRDRVLQRALEHWQPTYMGWWFGMRAAESRNRGMYCVT